MASTSSSSSSSTAPSSTVDSNAAPTTASTTDNATIVPTHAFKTSKNSARENGALKSRGRDWMMKVFYKQFRLTTPHSVYNLAVPHGKAQTIENGVKVKPSSNDLAYRTLQRWLCRQATAWIPQWNHYDRGSDLFEINFFVHPHAFVLQDADHKHAAFHYTNFWVMPKAELFEGGATRAPFKDGRIATVKLYAAHWMDKVVRRDQVTEYEYVRLYEDRAFFAMEQYRQQTLESGYKVDGAKVEAFIRERRAAVPLERTGLRDRSLASQMVSVEHELAQVMPRFPIADPLLRRLRLAAHDEAATSLASLTAPTASSTSSSTTTSTARQQARGSVSRGKPY
jgi:hypothetical protein